jgi:hypothetical protein
MFDIPTNVTVIVKFFVYGVPTAKPFAIVAVTVAVTAAVVFRTLPPVILAPVVPALLTDHVMVWLVAFEGDTVPVKVKGVPAVADVGTPDMLVTGYNTVTVKFCV